MLVSKKNVGNSIFKITLVSLDEGKFTYDTFVCFITWNNCLSRRSISVENLWTNREANRASYKKVYWHTLIDERCQLDILRCEHPLFSKQLKTFQLTFKSQAVSGTIFLGRSINYLLILNIARVVIAYNLI